MKPEHVVELVKLRLEHARIASEDAQFLLNGKRSPQSIINRACYAMFYAVLALLQTTSKVPAKHTGVLSLFDTEFVMKGIFPKALSKDFHQAFELRQVSDYQPVKPLTFAEAQDISAKSQLFVDNVKQYLKTKEFC